MWWFDIVVWIWWFRRGGSAEEVVEVQGRGRGRGSSSYILGRYLKVDI